VRDDRPAYEQPSTDDLELLLSALPTRIREPLDTLEPRGELLEIVMDLGREPEARFAGREELLSEQEVTADDLAYVVARIGAFGADNRAGIPRTLHRISALRNRTGAVVGLTLRVGRSVRGTVEILRDLVVGGRSLLLLGRWPTTCAGGWSSWTPPTRSPATGTSPTRGSAGRAACRCPPRSASTPS
jgi:stage III sporulation protein SpoIIIAA